MKISRYLNSTLFEENITQEDIVKQFSEQRLTFALLMKVESNQFAVDGAHLRKLYYCHLANNVVDNLGIFDTI